MKQAQSTGKTTVLHGEKLESDLRGIGEVETKVWNFAGGLDMAKRRYIVSPEWKQQGDKPVVSPKVGVRQATELGHASRGAVTGGFLFCFLVGRHHLTQCDCARIERVVCVLSFHVTES